MFSLQSRVGPAPCITMSTHSSLFLRARADQSLSASPKQRPNQKHHRQNNDNDARDRRDEVSKNDRRNQNCESYRDNSQGGQPSLHFDQARRPSRAAHVLAGRGRRHHNLESSFHISDLVLQSNQSTLVVLSLARMREPRRLSRLCHIANNIEA